MQQFFEKHKKKLLRGGILLLVLITVIASGKQLNVTLLESAIGVVVTPFQDLTTGISSWVDETVTASRNKTDLKKENTELKHQIAELLEENRRLAMYEEENATLSLLLKIAQKYPDYESVGATVIAKDPGVWYDGFTIDKGTKDEVNVVCSDDINILYQKNKRPETKREVVLEPNLIAPMKQGDRAGELVVTSNGTETSRCTVVLESDMPKMNAAGVFGMIFKNWIDLKL